MKIYLEIEKLKAYLKKGKISFLRINGEKPYFFPVLFSINDKSWQIFIDDEYEHFNPDNLLICLYLILSALEEYKESSDYLQWCKFNNLNASDLIWLDYYKSLKTIYLEIESELGEIDACISDYDYTLRTGVTEELLKYDIRD